jgi:Ca-activated chloride channel family protein
VVSLGALPLFLLLASASPQQDRAVFRIATRAVQVDVFVGRNGRAVPGLRPKDFELFDDGNRQVIESVGVEQMPLSVFLVLDVSKSVRGETLGYLKNAASAFLDALSERDRAGLLTFSHHLELRSDLTTDVSSVQRALHGVEAEGATSWRDALFAALELLETVHERPMVLLFTDGADTYSWLGTEQMLPLVKQSNVVLYAVTRAEELEMPDLRTTASRENWRASRREHGSRTRLLRELASETGGRLLETRSFDKLQELFLEILAEMKTRYILTYLPQEPLTVGWHSLEVRVKQRGVDVQSRRGYYYELER